ncbi:regulatory protein RecX [Fusobacterium sp. IOR10]|uniref:regulatory protein RecX n=1 Tax=Fusobacterium sp. IOR10 TaxID=2665157 RepID=UPI0013D057A3|nr:RecX family transcriptional regulator [Fusobacterium sp. IOR10]
MKVIKIQKSKIYFENNVCFSIPKNKIKELNLTEGKCLENKLYLEILKESALSFSYWLLTKRDYSIKELRIKLLTKYKEPTIISDIISLLNDRCYLDDWRFAKGFINTHTHWGRKKLEYFLALKGVDESIITNLLNENNPHEFEEIKKKWLQMKDKDDYKKIQSLMRKGFEYQNIKKVIDEL